MTRPSDKELAALLRKLSVMFSTLSMTAEDENEIHQRNMRLCAQADTAADALDREAPSAPAPVAWAWVSKATGEIVTVAHSRKPNEGLVGKDWPNKLVPLYAAASPSGPSWSERVEKAITASFRLTKPLTDDQRKFYESRISEIESNLRAAFPEYAPAPEQK